MSDQEVLNILLSIIGSGTLITIGLIIGLFKKVNGIDVKLNSHIAESDTKIKYLEKTSDRVHEEIIQLKTKRA